MSAEALEPGDLVCCPRCAGSHPAVIRITEGTPYERLMLFVQCGRCGWIYVGQRGLPSRHPVIEAA